MIATGNAVLHAGAKPVLVDCEPDTWCIDVDQARNKVTEKTKAVIPVHIYGHLCDMPKLFDLHIDTDLPIIEDAAEVHGSTYGYTKAGVLNEMAVYSFFANKNMTTGEGGIIVTNNEAYAKKAQWLKANAFGTGKNHFLHKAVANTVCMSAMQAALGLSQLKRLDVFVDLKRRNAKIYNALLKDLADDGLIILPTERGESGYKNSYWMYSILINESFGLTRDQLMDALEKDGVETRTFFIPLHKQPCFKKYAEGQSFPVADRISAQGLNLPSSSLLKVEEIKYICDCIHKHARHR
jgi:perosamine synthetase